MPSATDVKTFVAIVDIVPYLIVCLSQGDRLTTF